MRYLFGCLCVCALGVFPLVGCSETSGDGGSGGSAGSGGSGGCADWAGEWTLSSVSCDGVGGSVPDVDFSLAANCTAEQILTESAIWCTSAKHLGQEGAFVKRRFMVLA